MRNINYRNNKQKKKSKIKAFSLIETILYISLLSIIMTGIFSSLISYMQSKKAMTPFSEDDYQLLILNFHE